MSSVTENSVLCLFGTRKQEFRESGSVGGGCPSDPEVWVGAAAGHSATSGKNSSMVLYPLFPMMTFTRQMFQALPRIRAAEVGAHAFILETRRGEKSDSTGQPSQHQSPSRFRFEGPRYRFKNQTEPAASTLPRFRRHS